VYPYHSDTVGVLGADRTVEMLGKACCCENDLCLDELWEGGGAGGRNWNIGLCTV
jgi:hypothetical protein